MLYSKYHTVIWTQGLSSYMISKPMQSLSAMFDLFMMVVGARSSISVPNVP